MIVRRIRDHASSHNWFAVVVDVSIVFLGVFLGIQANNWNEARLGADEAFSDRLRLIEDLRTNEIDLNGRILYYRSVRDHALKALRVFSGNEPAPGEAFLVNAYQASNIRQRPMRRFTYDELVSNGNLGRVGDRELRERLDLHYLGLRTIDANIREIPVYRDRIRREMPYEVQVRVRSRCGDEVREVKGAVIRVLPANCRLGLEPQKIAAAIRQLQAAPEMDRDLTRYITDIDQKLDAYELTQSQSKEVRESLERTQP